MTNRQLVLETMKRAGRLIARNIQNNAAGMSGTELNAEADYIPGFTAACARMNMLDRPIGFVCSSTAGRVVKLIQPYDSAIFPQEPEELPAQWGFQWSTDPAKALPFVALATSPYNTGDCCTYDGHVWRSGQDGNVWAPGTVNISWEDLGAVST